MQLLVQLLGKLQERETRKAAYLANAAFITKHQEAHPSMKVRDLAVNLECAIVCGSYYCSAWCVAVSCVVAV